MKIPRERRYRHGGADRDNCPKRFVRDTKAPTTSSWLALAAQLITGAAADIWPGAVAHSYTRLFHHAFGRRWSNEKNPERYMTRVAERKQAVVEEGKSTWTKRRRIQFSGLKMTEGFALQRFCARFASAVEMYPRIANGMDGDSGRKPKHLKLTRKGCVALDCEFSKTLGRPPVALRIHRPASQNRLN